MSIKVEEPRTRRNTVCVPHSWLEAYASAMTQSDPSKLIGCVEYAITAIERRYSEWGTHPGTPAELAAIQKCISALEHLMKQERHGRRGAVYSTASRENSEATSLHSLEYLNQHIPAVREGHS